MRMTRLALLALAATLALPLLAADKAGQTLPDGVIGFKGTLTGTVGEVGPRGMIFDLKVAKAAAGEGSTAKAPAEAEGKNLMINAQWEKDGEKWRAIPAHVAWIKSLKAGQEVTVTVVNDEGGRLHLVEVPAVK